MIPKRIIQTGPANLSLILRSAVVNAKLLHPEFEYLFFDDAKVEWLVEEHFPEFRSAFHSFQFKIQKYDFFRYLAIYHYGGFYLDLDVFLAQDLTPLLSSDCVFPFEELTEITYFWHQFGMDWQIGNYAFGAAPGHPFVAKIIDNCLRAKDDPSWAAPMMKGIPGPFRAPYHVTNTTGPGLVSRTLAENPKLAETVNILFPDDVRDPRTWHQFGSYGVHHMVGSWRDRSSFLSRPFTRFWDSWSLRRRQARCRASGKTRQLGSQVASAATSSAPSEVLS